MKRKVFILFQLIIGVVLIWQIFGTSMASAQTQPKDNLLGVVIMVNGNTIKVKGYCIYVKDGKEIRKELEKDNAWGWNFRGEYIKEVKIQKVSGDASYRLFIMEGKDSASGQPVFESESISSTEPVVYKRNQ
ncbi:MAG TPA: hypothetical protein ENG87_04695 [Candidatus Pacearchaeota archaeon]|nr:hypothetical protein [Nitrospirota bacterium]HDK42655.1 hypothetical protein [Candidatus Pacearchaeota archaeon]